MCYDNGSQKSRNKSGVTRSDDDAHNYELPEEDD